MRGVGEEAVKLEGSKRYWGKEHERVNQSFSVQYIVVGGKRQKVFLRRNYEFFLYKVVV